MPRSSPLLVLFVTFLLFASACGSDDTTDLSTAADADAQSQPEGASQGEGEDATQDEAPVPGEGDEGDTAPAEDDVPMPVEPDGGIGDGAGPIPLDEDGEADEGDVTDDGDVSDEDDVTDEGDVEPTDEDAPIPVEPDGGIGDGAEPLPGAEDPEETGTWHGSEVAETNCPGIAWQRVEASTFSFSLPTTFVNDEVQGIDSEVGQWSNGDGIQVSYDYGWYSYSIADAGGAEVDEVDFSGVSGQFAVVRAAETSAETNSVGVYFPEVNFADEVWDKLGLIITHDDPNDEIIGRCIARSIEWS